MPNASAAVLSPGSVRRDRSVQVHREARNAKAERERQIVGLLNRGISVAETASRSGISIKHMRNLVRKILAERMPVGALLLSSGRLAREARADSRRMAPPIIYVSIEWIVALFHRMTSGLLFCHRNAKDKSCA